MDIHAKAVAVISANVRYCYDHKEPFRIYHGSTNSTRQSQLGQYQKIDTSKLNHVLSVDANAKTAWVEPNVPMDSLVEATLPHGLIPPVIMEFPGITAGGGFSGTAGESSSFRYGFFDRTVIAIEMVLANGEKIQASRTENSDLFYGAASSFGTLGVITLLQLQLIEAKAYVELTYHPVNSVLEAVKTIEETTEDTSNDYLDGILFSKDSGVILSGRLTNTPKAGVKIQTFTRATDPWFYIHVERTMKMHRGFDTVTEAIPLVDYLFRYDRGGFWVGKYAFRYFLTPLTALLVGPWTTSCTRASCITHSIRAVIQTNTLFKTLLCPTLPPRNSWSTSTQISHTILSGSVPSSRLAKRANPLTVSWLRNQPPMRLRCYSTSVSGDPDRRADGLLWI